MAKHQDITSVSLHHEQACAFAAIGYAEKTNGLGMALVSTGCGSTNAITGVLSAWQDGVPCIFISGQNILHETSHFTGVPVRTYGQQEADIVKIVEPITKYCHMITSADEVEAVMDRAITEALTGRKGPVWIDVPLDLQSALVTADPSNRPLETSKSDPVSNKDDLDYIRDAFSKSERPVLLIGKGIRSANVEKELRVLVTRINSPLCIRQVLLIFLDPRTNYLLVRSVRWDALAPQHLLSCELRPIACSGFQTEFAHYRARFL